jgi:hypothetical protein
MSSAYIHQGLRQRVAEQARHRCGYCLSQEAVVGSPMEVDHLFPRALGGPSVEANLWLTCSLCNEHKGARIAGVDPQTGLLARLFNPRHQIWQEHFAWTDSGTRIVGKTAIGRATVEALELNRPSLVDSRKIWVEAGWHPPTD